MRFKFSVLSYFLIPADEIKELPINLKVAVIPFFFNVSLLVTANVPETRLECTDAYFEK